MSDDGRTGLEWNGMECGIRVNKVVFTLDNVFELRKLVLVVFCCRI